MLVDPLKQLNQGASVLYEMAGSGVATAFEISSWRPMTMEEFKRDIVPTLTGSPAEGKFHYYVLRDLSNGRLLTVYPDGAIEYTVENVRDANVEDVLRELQEDHDNEDNVQEAVINSTWPVFGYKDGTTWSLSVKIPETRFRFKNPLLFRNPDEAPFIYMPPVIFQIIGRDKHINNRYVWVLAQDSLSEDYVKRAQLPLPNVWHGGKICVGRTASLNENVGNVSKMQLLMQAWDLFINSAWNFDLLNVDLFPANLDEVYLKYKKADSTLVKKAGQRNEERVTKLLQLLEILSEPGRWEELQWREA